MSADLSFEINLVSIAWIFKKRWKWKQAEFLIFDGKSVKWENTQVTSNLCKRQTTWPKWLKFLHKKCQSILFKTWSISNPYLLAWRSTSLTESDNSGGWPCIQAFQDTKKWSIFWSGIRIDGKDSEKKWWWGRGMVIVGMNRDEWPAKFHASEWVIRCKITCEWMSRCMKRNEMCMNRRMD